MRWCFKRNYNLDWNDSRLKVMVDNLIISINNDIEGIIYLFDCLVNVFNWVTDNSNLSSSVHKVL